MDASDEAVGYITTCCHNIGAFSGASDVHRFLKRVAWDMAASQPSVVFPDGYVEHVAYAVDMVASNFMTEPPAAVASVYLATRFEFYFRVLSGKLNADGTWTTPQAQAAAMAGLTHPRLRKKLGGKRVSSVALAYKIMKLDQSLATAQRCAELDRTLYPNPITLVFGVEVCDIGDRIEFGRHAAGHGHWGDISSERLFYGLMTALIFYTQRSRLGAPGC